MSELDLGDRSWQDHDLIELVGPCINKGFGAIGRPEQQLTWNILHPETDDHQNQRDMALLTYVLATIWYHTWQMMNSAGWRSAQKNADFSQTKADAEALMQGIENYLKTNKRFVYGNLRMLVLETCSDIPTSDWQKTWANFDSFDPELDQLLYGIEGRERIEENAANRWNNFGHSWVMWTGWDGPTNHGKLDWWGTICLGGSQDVVRNSFGRTRIMQVNSNISQYMDSRKQLVIDGQTNGKIVTCKDLKEALMLTQEYTAKGIETALDLMQLAKA